MDFKILWFIDKLKPLFEKMGINYKIMRNILYVKLLMDGRKVPTVLANGKINEYDNSNKFLKSLWMYALMGLILIPFIIMKNNYIFQMSVVFAVIMFFIMTSLISDFSSVLLDVRDKNIIGTRPVEAKTLQMAKTIHILIYMFFITAALVGPALIISLFTQGFLFFVFFLVSVIFMDLFSVVLTSLLYLVVLRLFDGEKLKDIINYFQILLSIVIMAGYQLVGRLFHVVNLNIEFSPSWWQFFLAPVWFSAPFQMIKTGEIKSTYLVFTVLAILVPVIAMVAYVRMMPLFEKYIQKLSNNNGNKKKVKRNPAIFISKLLCRNNEEQIFYRFAVNMMKNEREFKLKVYPSLGFSLVLPFIFFMTIIFSSDAKVILNWQYFMMIYFCGMMLPTIAMMVRYSESYKAAWIYKALPVKNFSAVFKGTIKAYIVKLFVPMFLLEAIIFVALLGFRIIPYLLIVFINMLIYNFICFYTLNKTLPFSKSFGATQQPDFGIVLLLFLILAVLAVSQYIFLNINYGIYINLLLSLSVNLILWKVAYNVSPEKLNTLLRN